MNIKLKIVRLVNKIILATQKEGIFTERLVKKPIEYYIEVKE